MIKRLCMEDHPDDNYDAARFERERMLAPHFLKAQGIMAITMARPPSREEAPPFESRWNICVMKRGIAAPAAERTTVFAASAEAT